MLDLSLNVMDISQNSISAGATKLFVSVEEINDKLTIIIEDNGKGMSKEVLSKVDDPFYTTRTTRKVGLGLSLFKMQAQLTGGDFSISSKEHIGTKVKAIFFKDHVDMLPLGDMTETVWLLITCNPKLDVIYNRGCNGKSFTLKTSEIKDELGDDELIETPEVVAWIKEYLTEKTTDICRKDD